MAELLTGRSTTTSVENSDKLLVCFSPGLNLLVWLFQPSHALGTQLVRYLRNQDQLQLAATCCHIRCLVIPHYRLSLKKVPEFIYHEAVNQFLCTYRPAIRYLFIQLGVDLQPDWSDTIRQFLSQIDHLEHIDFGVQNPVEWPAVVRCLDHLPPSSVQKLSVYFRDTYTEPLQTYQDNEKQYFSKALYGRLTRIRSFSVSGIFTEGSSTDLILQMLAPFTSLQTLHMYVGNPDGQMCREMAARYSHLTRLALPHSRWHLSLLLGPRPPVFNRLVSLEFMCGDNLVGIQTLNDIVAADYPCLI
ncbi:hypothetical protein H4R33_004604, partial [Dimargaris cristalligena]